MLVIYDNGVYIYTNVRAQLQSCLDNTIIVGIFFVRTPNLYDMLVMYGLCYFQIFIYWSGKSLRYFQILNEITSKGKHVMTNICTI